MDVDIDVPVLDDHLHLDPVNGDPRGSVEEFADAGGTHLLVVNKPSWTLGVTVEERADFREGFELTIGAVETANDVLNGRGRAWPVLGVHPALVSRLVDERGFEPTEARELMGEGLAVAAEYAGDGRALALKSGRPHYPVSEAVWDTSNAVLRRALALGAEHDCAVQLHTEASEDLAEIGEWAAERGMEPERVVKHYASGPTEGVTQSVISHKDELRAAVDGGEPFMMETDFLDDPDRPGAVLGPRTVPRRTRWLLEAGHEAAVRRAHTETPARVYDIDP